MGKLDGWTMLPADQGASRELTYISTVAYMLEKHHEGQD